MKWPLIKGNLISYFFLSYVSFHSLRVDTTVIARHYNRPPCLCKTWLLNILWFAADAHRGQSRQALAYPPTHSSPGGCTCCTYRNLGNKMAIHFMLLSQSVAVLAVVSRKRTSKICDLFFFLLQRVIATVEHFM